MGVNKLILQHFVISLAKIQEKFYFLKNHRGQLTPLPSTYLRHWASDTRKKKRNYITNLSENKDHTSTKMCIKSMCMLPILGDYS